MAPLSRSLITLAALGSNGLLFAGATHAGSGSGSDSGIPQPLPAAPAGPFAALSPKRWAQECVEHALHATGQAGTTAASQLRRRRHPALPKVAALNGSAFEQWEFDATSDDGALGLMVGLVRDANYDGLLGGGSRVNFHYSAVGPASGRAIGDMAVLESSWVWDCPGGVVAGRWLSAPEHGVDVRWSVSRDSSLAALQMVTPRFAANLTFVATAPAHYPDGSGLVPEGDEDVVDDDDDGDGNHVQPPSASLVGQGIHVLNAISGATVEGSVREGPDDTQAKPFVSSGAGGMLRIWTARTPMWAVGGLRVVRSVAGPYTFTVWMQGRWWAEEGEDTGADGNGGEGQGEGAVQWWGSLYHGTERLAATRSLGHMAADTDLEGDRMRVKSVRGAGGVRSKMGDGTVTGVQVEFESGSTGRTWRFDVEQTVRQGVDVVFGYGFDKFTNKVLGGEVTNKEKGEGGTDTEEDRYHGSAWSEDAIFPDEVPGWVPWSAYVVYKVRNMAAKAMYMVRGGQAPGWGRDEL